MCGVEEGGGAEPREALLDFCEDAVEGGVAVGVVEAEEVGGGGEGGGYGGIVGVGAGDAVDEGGQGRGNGEGASGGAEERMQRTKRGPVTPVAREKSLETSGRGRRRRRRGLWRLRVSQRLRTGRERASDANTREGQVLP